MAPSLSKVATACMACGAMMQPLGAYGQTRMASFSVPVRVMSAGCTLSTAGAAAGSGALAMNCGGVVMPAGVGSVAPSVGSAVLTSGTGGVSALAVMSVPAGVRAPSGGFSFPRGSNTLRAVDGSGGTLRPAGAQGLTPPDQPDPNADGGGDAAGGGPAPSDDPLPPNPADPPETLVEVLNFGNFHSNMAAKLIPSQVARIRHEGHVQMLVVF